MKIMASRIVHPDNRPAPALDTWFERDRAMVRLYWPDTEATIAEWWDEDVGSLVEAGFLDPRDWHGSAMDYAKHIGLL